MLPFVRHVSILPIYHFVIAVYREYIQVQRDDGVTTVPVTGQRVVVNALGLEESRLVESAQTKADRVSFTDRVDDRGVLNRQYVHVTHVRAIVPVMRAQVFNILISSVYIFNTFPLVRRLIRTDGHGIAEQVRLMYMEREAVDRIATVNGREGIAVTLRLSCAQVDRRALNERTALDMLPYIRRVCHGDMLGVLVEVAVKYIESQFDDRVATVLVTGQRVVVNALGLEESRLVESAQTKLDRVTETERINAFRPQYRTYFNIDIAYTVVSVVRQSVKYVLACRADIVTVLPCVRGLVVTEDHGIFLDPIGLVDKEREAVDRVTSVDGSHLAFILARSSEQTCRVNSCTVFADPAVLPFIRSLLVGDMYNRVRHLNTVAYEQAQLDHAVATELGLNRIPISSCLVNPALVGLISLVTVEAVPRTFANRVAQLLHIRLVIIDAKDIDAVILDSRRQRVGIEHGVVCQRSGVLLYVTGTPCMFQRLVELFAYIDRVAEDMRLMNREVQAVDAVATELVRIAEGVQTACAEGVGRILTDIELIYPFMFP